MQLKVLGLQGATSINAVRDATAGMTEWELAASLAKTKLTASEQEQLLVESGLSSSRASMIAATNTMSEGDLYAALTKTSLVNKINEETLAESGLTQQQIAAAVAASSLNAENLALILSLSGLNTEQQIAILMNKGLTEAQAEAIMATSAQSTANVTATTTTMGLAGATSSLTTALHGLKVAIASNPIGFIATVAVIAIAGINALVDRIESASEKLEKSSQDVADIESKLKGLNSELETTEKRIKELDRMGSLTLVQKNELRNLKKANAELKQEIALQKQLLATAQRANEQNFINAVNSKASTSEKNEKYRWYYPLLPGISDWFSQDYREWHYGSTDDNQERFDKYVEDYYRANEEDATKDVFDNWIASKSTMRDFMANYIQELSGYIEKLGDYDYDTLSDDAKAAVDLYYDNLNKFSVLTGDFANAWDNVYNQDRFEAARTKLENAADGGLTKDEVANLYNNDADVKAMIDNMKEVGLISGDVGDNFANIATQIANADDNIESFSAHQKIEFKDLFSSESVQDVVSEFESDLSYLSNALNDYLNGDFSDSDLVGLFEKFPELAGRTDDLDVALTELIERTQQNVDNQFDEWEESMPNEEDAKSLNAVRNALHKIGDTATGISKVTSEISKLNGILDDLQDVYNDIDGIIKDYNENGYYSTDDLQKLLELEPEYLNLLIDENGQINLNSQAYKNYMAAKAKSLLLDQVTSLYESILGMSIEEAQAYANAEAYEKESSSIESLTRHYLELAKAKDIANNTTVYTSAMERSFPTVANYAAIYDSWLNSLNSSTNEFTKQTNGAKDALEAEKDALESQKDALEDYKDSLEDSKDALEDYKNSLETAQDDLQSLIDLVIDYIKQTKENEKSAIQDSIDALNDKKSALDDQKDAYSDLIDKRKEEIEALYEEKKAQDELSEKQKSVAKDALALAIAQLDDSSAGRKAQKQAQDNLNSSNKDLKDYLEEQEKDKRITALEEEEAAYDEMIERRKAAIDAQVEHLESKIDEIDAYLDNSRKMYEDACSMIDNDNGTLYGNLWNYTYEYTTKTRAEFDNLWSNAQLAIQRYKGDNDTLIGTMETLQQKIYDTDGEIADLNTQIDECETQIGYLDDAIDSTSDAISATSDSIDSVSGSLDGLGSSIADYMAQLAELSAAANNIDISPNANGEKTKFWVTHNGKTYETGYNYNGDTEGNRLLAAAELTKLIAKDISGFDQYGLGIVQGYLGVGTTGAKEWYVDVNGKRYTAVSKTKDNAIRQIMAQGLDPRAGYYVRDHIKHYASGTRSSNGGLSVTQENGLEAIFGKLSSGKYTFMNEGSHVFDKDATENLHDFADRPMQYISRIMGQINYGDFMSSRAKENIKLMEREIANNSTSNSGNITMHFAPVTTIQGNADRDTINQMDRFYEKYKERFMLDILREKNNL